MCNQLIILNDNNVSRTGTFLLFFSTFAQNAGNMIQMTFPVSEEEHRKFFTLKYTFIRQGNITVSNSEIMSKLLEEYISAHKDEIVEIPDAVYKNYVEKGRRTVKKRMATIERKRRDLK